MRLDVLLAIFGISFIAFTIGAYLISSVRQKRTDALFELLLKKLPSWNCGLCGEITCADFSKKLVASSTEGWCIPGGQAVESSLYSVLGKDPYTKTSGKSVAVVACAGGSDAVKPLYQYEGYKDCVAAAKIYGGPRACGSGCLGYGTCIYSCSNHAISVAKGLAVINPDLCNGCGACISVCPTGVIHMLPRRDAWYIACSSTASPNVKTKSCSASCTGCGACERRSAGSEFMVKNNLAIPSTTTTGNWAAIAEDCPTGVIRCLYKEKKAARPFGTKDGGL